MFREATDERVEKFSQSIAYDRRLYAHDIRASQAHAQMLAKVGLITEQECQQIEQALEQIRGEIDRGEFPFSAALEDIHMHVEGALIDRLGDVGRKLHTGRSRNDQVSTDLRLWVREAIERLEQRLTALQRALIRKAEQSGNLILPGYTHMRRAQPVLAAHYLLAYCEKLQRDRQRLSDCLARSNHLPLGTAALAGTSLPLDRQWLATQLGFDGLMANSLDASSDRDFVLEFVFALALIAEHLSGWAEEWILWSTCEFDFLSLPQSFCTGSSIMPQKVNPDVLELIRGKTARVVGALQSLLVLVKGLPLAYNRDLQEDKLPLFDAYDTVTASLELAVPIVEGAQFERARIEERLDRGYLDATTLMEYLVRCGVPQRTAHHMVGSLVQMAIERDVPLAELPLADLRQICPQLDEQVYQVLGVERAVQAFTGHGSTAPHEVAQQIAQWKVRTGI